VEDLYLMGAVFAQGQNLVELIEDRWILSLILHGHVSYANYPKEYFVNFESGRDWLKPIPLPYYHGMVACHFIRRHQSAMEGS
jgi:hypothetical protein